jgi:UDP-N-acetyl-D-galactosamine dehydrogenase
MIHIGIIGLGYVGLPLGIEFSKKYNVTGFDINERRINDLKDKNDRTIQVSSLELSSCKMKFTSDVKDLESCNYFIITVPTPINENKRPDLTPLLKASETVGKILKRGDIVVYESTVFPGCTEEECVPVLERFSSLTYNKDFFCGYSPERINPGDKVHTLENIVKITSGSNNDTAQKVNELYSSIIKAGTFLVSSIKVAEAAKVIENTQRDLNIAFVNELSIIFERMGLDTAEVLNAAGTKWNFLKFTPGLVGGHCIGVDPYYLTHKAEALGYHPQVILAGRRINDSMGEYVARQVIKLMIKKGVYVNRARILILGISFKENCSDVRNSRVIDIINELKEYGCDTEVYDPYADKTEVEREFGVKLSDNKVMASVEKFDSVILAVAHDSFKDLTILKERRTNQVFYDLKSLYPKEYSDGRL